MKRMAALFLLASCSIAYAADVENAVAIPVKPQGFGERLPLLQEIPVSKTKTIVIKLIEVDGQCHINMGTLKANLGMPAPCDIKTKGAAYGFKPVVTFDETTDKITAATEVAFSIVGGLKFYPVRRTECGDQLRVVRLKFKKSSTAAGFEPFLNMSEMISRQGNLSSHCPRQYDDLK